MRYRKLTSTGDYSFGNGQLDFWINAPEGVAQAVQTRLLLWTGEWFLDVDEGTPYMQGVFGKHSQTEADITIQTRVGDTQGLVDIENYNSTLNRDDRSLSVSMDINTIYGPTSLDVQNLTDF